MFPDAGMKYMGSMQKRKGGKHMFAAEKKTLMWLEKHLLPFFVVFVVLLGLGIRFALREVESIDSHNFLLPWYDEIKEAGGLWGLGGQVGNYNMPYQTLIALLTYLPVKPLYAYKILSCCFDYLLAAGVMLCVFSLTKSRWKAVFAFSGVVLSPVVFLNSAAWGQCDSIFTAFLVLSLLMLCRERYIPSFVLLGLAFAFKLQAVFLLPFYLFVYFVKKRFSLLHFLLIPAVMLAASLPNILMGRNPLDVFTLYAYQTGTWQRMYMNYPSFWALLSGDSAANYDLLRPVAIALTLGLLAGLMAYWVYKKVDLTPDAMLRAAFLLAYTCVLFLPAMHERYGYVYEILAIILAFRDKKTIPLMLGLMALSSLTYGHYLFKTSPSLMLLAAINLLIYAGYLLRWLPGLSVRKAKARTAEERSDGPEPSRPVEWETDQNKEESPCR